MQLSKILAFVLLLSVSYSCVGPKNGLAPWRKRAKLAAALERSGDLEQAATLYRGIYEEKPEKLEYLYKAGVCFLEFRAYQNAVDAFEPLQKEIENPKYEKPCYKYALALKQLGKPQAAKDAFNYFLLHYQGSDKEEYRLIIENEIKGCNYALKARNYTNPAIKIDHLSNKINSKKVEFAPIPFANDVLYFSSTVSGVAAIYRTVKQDDDWLKPQIPSIFLDKMERTHFGNGTFTTDGVRFYFTQCDIEAGKPQCAIYLMENLGGGQWSDPVMLPDYINPENVNTTHPLVVDLGDQEVLYFSSNRSGGRGGLDLWYCTRPKSGDTKSFTLPKNLGRNINSVGDEISPFYHQATGTLYFSSNGRVSAGGLDIFKSKGAKLQWEVAQNMGFPINSAADDLYYTISEAHGGGYLVSNRPFAPQRTNTTDDDIFYFGVESIDLEWLITVHQANDLNKTALEAVNMQLFQRTQDGTEELIEEKLLTNGTLQFQDLTPNSNYLLLITKKDYKSYGYEFTTGAVSKQEEALIALEPRQTTVAIPRVDPQLIRHYLMPSQYNSNARAYPLPLDPIDPVSGIAYEGDTLKIFYELDAIAGLGDQRRLYYDKNGQPQPYHAPIIAPDDPQEDYPAVPGPYAPSAVAPDNVVYKIQVSAVRNFKPYKYEELKEIGRLTTEEIAGGLQRILVINKEEYIHNIQGYKRKSDALNALSYVLNNSSFQYAFVIKYVDGERVGEGFRGWNEEEGLKTDTKPDGRIIEDTYEGF
ncbi:MAG: outer membrane peptidoglycan-associated protein [Aureispira sp.]